MGARSGLAAAYPARTGRRRSRRRVRLSGSFGAHFHACPDARGGSSARSPGGACRAARGPSAGRARDPASAAQISPAAVGQVAARRPRGRARPAPSCRSRKERSRGTAASGTSWRSRRADASRPASHEPIGLAAGPTSPAARLLSTLPASPIVAAPSSTLRDRSPFTGNVCTAPARSCDTKTVTK